MKVSLVIHQVCEVWLTIILVIALGILSLECLLVLCWSTLLCLALTNDLCIENALSLELPLLPSHIHPNCPPYLYVVSMLLYSDLHSNWTHTLTHKQTSDHCPSTLFTFLLIHAYQLPRNLVCCCIYLIFFLFFD